MNNPDVYFAAPLFCEAEKNFNLKVVRALEGIGLSVFLPQRDGQELAMSPGAEAAIAIYTLDKQRLTEAAIVVALLDGVTQDPGVCIELGLAASLKEFSNPHKFIIGFSTDSRAFQPANPLNPMVEGTLDALVSSEEELIAQLRLTPYCQKHFLPTQGALL